MAQSKLLVEEVKSRVDTEDELNLFWTIPHFKELCANAKSKNGEESVVAQVKFTVGGKFFSNPTHWRFNLWHHTISVSSRQMGIFLDFLGPGSASATWQLFMKSPTGEFERKTAPQPMKYPKYEPINIKDTSVCAFGFLANLQQDDLQFKINFKVSHPPTENTCLKGDLSKDLKKGLDSGVGADMTFIFVEEEGSQNIIAKIPAHRAILSLRSSVFASMFQSGMTEATSGEVWICDMTPKAMKILLNYIYSGEVDSEWGSVADELLYGANKYELTRLQKYLDENVATILTPENVMKIRKMASLYNLQEAMESTVKFVEKNVSAFLMNQDVMFNNLNLK